MSKLPADLLVQNATHLYPVSGPAPLRGDALRQLEVVEDGAVAAHDGTIVAVGRTDEVRRRIRVLPGAEILDAEERAVIPGLVDPHTHAVFTRPRSEEFGRRLVGETYQSIAASGGGIRASVRSFREADEGELLRLTRRRLRGMLRYGTTTAEVKSGYGLELESELKALRILHELSADDALPRILPTCLAAHEVPDEYREDRERYLSLVCDEILPTVARAGLAERVDVFCEPGVFSVEESRRVLEAGMRLGLHATVHADELEGSGGARLAAEMQADSADHLGCIDETGIAALADSETVAVLLPGTIFSLGLHNWAPARRLVEEGAVVALASDYNPGSNYCESLPLVMAIACTRMGLHPLEALAMSTLNAAFALRRHEEVGSLEEGKRADLLILRESSLDGTLHHLGLDPVETTLRGGRVVYQRRSG
jgi:imidazolonepropionase